VVRQIILFFYHFALAMASSQGRSLQDILGNPSSSRQEDRPSPNDITGTESDTEDMDFEPTSDDGSDDQQAYLEALVREDSDLEVGDEIDGEGDEDEGIHTPLHSSLVPGAKIGPLDATYGELQVEIEEEEDDQDATQSEAERSEPPYILTFILTVLLIFRVAVARQRRQVIRLLATSELGRLFRFAEEDDEFEQDGDGEYGTTWRRRRRRPPPDPNRFPKVPSDEGTELMSSGTFGSNEEDTIYKSERGSIGKKKKLARRILDRELSTESHAKQRLNQRLMAQVQTELSRFVRTWLISF
jgi:WD repeat-containing protein 23